MTLKERCENCRHDKKACDPNKTSQDDPSCERCTRLRKQCSGRYWPANQRRARQDEKINVEDINVEDINVEDISAEDISAEDISAEDGNDEDGRDQQRSQRHPGEAPSTLQIQTSDTSQLRQEPSPWMIPVYPADETPADVQNWTLTTQHRYIAPTQGQIHHYNGNVMYHNPSSLAAGAPGNGQHADDATVTVSGETLSAENCYFNQHSDFQLFELEQPVEETQDNGRTLHQATFAMRESYEGEHSQTKQRLPFEKEERNKRSKKEN